MHIYGATHKRIEIWDHNRLSPAYMTKHTLEFRALLCGALTAPII